MTRHRIAQEGGRRSLDYVTALVGFLGRLFLPNRDTFGIGIAEFRREGVTRVFHLPV